jgi:hypothetical protein
MYKSLMKARKIFLEGRNFFGGEGGVRIYKVEVIR